MANRVSQQFHGFINTFPLWENSGAFEIEQFKLPELTLILPDEEDILKEIPALTNRFVLGKRIEGFFGYLIKRSSGYRIIAQNLQIIQDKITVGEIDFIVEDINAGESLHIEMVYKFYLYDPAINKEIYKWIGPNRKDSLHQKIKKLKEKQLPLLFHKETCRTLAALGINNKQLKQLVGFKARLFVPYNMLGKILPLINNSCICGYWIPSAEFNKKRYSESKYFLPQKADWPIDPSLHDEWEPFPIIYEKVSELNRKEISPLIWMKTPEGEFQRFFVVWW